MFSLACDSVETHKELARPHSGVSSQTRRCRRRAARRQIAGSASMKSVTACVWEEAIKPSDKKCVDEPQLVVTSQQELSISPSELEERAASAAHIFLSRLGSNVVPASTTPTMTETELVQRSVEDRAAQAAAKFLERIKAKPFETAHLAPYEKKHCRGKGRRVHFDFSAVVVYPIVPYSEVYGVHPREFVFGRNYDLLPAAPGGFVSLASLCCHESEEFMSDSDEEW